MAELMSKPLKVVTEQMLLWRLKILNQAVLHGNNWLFPSEVLFFVGRKGWDLYIPDFIALKLGPFRHATVQTSFFSKLVFSGYRL